MIEMFMKNKAHKYRINSTAYFPFLVFAISPICKNHPKEHKLAIKGAETKSIKRKIAVVDIQSTVILSTSLKMAPELILVQLSFSFFFLGEVQHFFVEFFGAHSKCLIGVAA